MMLRSILYVPANNGKFIAKAHLRGADAIILDLEDSVLDTDKRKARERLPQSVETCKKAGATVFVRINTRKKMALADACAALKAGADGIYVPKARLKRVSLLDTYLGPLEESLNLNKIPIIALIEDPKGVLGANKIARHNRVIALTVGAEDLANALGGVASPDVLSLPKQLVHFAAKANGKLSFGLFRSIANFSNLANIQSAAEEAKRFGFDGASCVHPSAIAILNAAFSATEMEIDWARQVLALATELDSRAFSYQGTMVDAPVLERAKRIISSRQPN